LLQRLWLRRSLLQFAADEFYVVQDVKTKKCAVIDKKPTESSMTVVSPSGTVYKTRAEAETGMKTVKVCSSHKEIIKKTCRPPLLS